MLSCTRQKRHQSVASRIVRTRGVIQVNIYAEGHVTCRDEATRVWTFDNRMRVLIDEMNDQRPPRGEFLGVSTAVSDHKITALPVQRNHTSWKSEVPGLC